MNLLLWQRQKWFLILLCSVAISELSIAEEPGFTTPRPFSFITHAPKDVYSYTVQTLQPDNWNNILGMAVTVISHNYSKYRFIRPFGYTLMTLLGYQMLNNGVHWMSDYPLGLALGYSFGKLAIKRYEPSKTVHSKPGSRNISFKTNPAILPGNVPGLSFVVRY